MKQLIAAAVLLLTTSAVAQPPSTRPPSTQPVYRPHPRTAEEAAAAHVAAGYIAARYPGDWKAMRPLLWDDPTWLKVCEIRATTQAAAMRCFALFDQMEQGAGAYEKSLQRTAELGADFGKSLESEYPVVVQSNVAVVYRQKPEGLEPIYRLKLVGGGWRVAEDLEEGPATVESLQARQGVFEKLERQLRDGQFKTRDQFFAAMRSALDNLDREPHRQPPSTRP